MTAGWFSLKPFLPLNNWLPAKLFRLDSFSGVHVSLQEHFDRTFISSTEICQRLGIARSTLFNGAKAGKLPEAIVIPRASGEGAHIMLWERVHAEPMMEEWGKAIESRKAR